jgi:hypothetical protein
VEFIIKHPGSLRCPLIGSVSPWIRVEICTASENSLQVKLLIPHVSCGKNVYRSGRN